MTNKNPPWALPLLSGLLISARAAVCLAQGADAVAKPVVFTVQEDHQDMMRQLGITALRPGPSGDAKAPNHANYDEALANPHPGLPDVLRLAGGEPVTTPEQWWTRRRPEIVEEVEREILGRIPDNVPGVHWEVRETRDVTIGGIEAVEKHVVGVVDNSACPEIEVRISMSLTVPKQAGRPVPVLMMFGRTPFDPTPPWFRGPPGGAGAQQGPTRESRLLAAGWGYAMLNPGSVQDDAGGVRQRGTGQGDGEASPGAGLTRGIIGLTNHGQPRKPDDWGALRAWGWGASRGLDYLGTEPTVDATKVGIEGVSRYGKAALTTMAFDQRFAMVLVGSSGKGGATLYRRNFGEAVENLTGSGEYHWMAGTFLKYGTEESAFGSMNAGGLPVDSHHVIALCAPRLTFVSYGVPEKGDANWLDQQGSFMATVAAQPVYHLLGAEGLGRSADYRSEKMPAVNEGLLDGDLAWRQHDGGHTDAPNIPHFIRWAEARFAPPMAALPVARTDQNSVTAHEQLLAKASQGTIDLYFVGDSIARRWGATDYPELLTNWRENFHGWNAADFAWGGDTTQNILWRLQHGELDGVNPKAIVVLAGTNNVGQEPPDAAGIAGIVSGIKAILDTCQEKAPEATIILTAIFPRNDNTAVMPTINQINEKLASLADGRGVRFLNVNDRLADADGRLFDGMTVDRLHPSLQGYQVWADGLRPLLTDILGPPAAEDHAPPPTGDPSASQ